MRVVEQPIQKRGDRSGVARSLAQSSTGRFDAISVEARSYRRMTISRRSPAAVCGSRFIPRSSMIRRGTVVTCATVRPFSKPASTSRSWTHVKTARCVSSAIRRRVREIVE
jgi:hypothetical protein